MYDYYCWFLILGEYLFYNSTVLNQTSKICNSKHQAFDIVSFSLQLLKKKQDFKILC